MDFKKPAGKVIYYGFYIINFAAIVIVLLARKILIHDKYFDVFLALALMWIFAAFAIQTYYLIRFRRRSMPLAVILTVAVFVTASILDIASKTTSEVRLPEHIPISLSSVFIEMGLEDEAGNTALFRQIEFTGAGEDRDGAKIVVDFISGLETNRTVIRYKKHVDWREAEWRFAGMEIHLPALIYRFEGETITNINIRSLLLHAGDGSVVTVWPKSISGGKVVYEYEINNDCLDVESGVFTGGSLNENSVLSKVYGFGIIGGIYRPVAILEAKHFPAGNFMRIVSLLITVKGLLIVLIAFFGKVKKDLSESERN